MNGTIDATGGSCLGCHATVKGNRADVVNHFKGKSHHIQGVAITNALCYQCHWEANSDGSMNATYHMGIPGGSVSLVVYGAGTGRPASYTTGTYVSYTANGARSSVEKLNSHCLGCHRSANATAKPFSDGKTPQQYAWDSRSIEERYANSGATRWSQYSTANTNRKKHLTKAYSAHGNAANNQMGWNTVTGVDGDITDISGNRIVACYDCHNSHGSYAAGTTVSYATMSSAKYNGGLFKNTTSGKGGYSMSYKPLAGGSSATRNAYNAGAGLCFDCHNNRTSTAGKMPWGYNDTFNAGQALNGYWDTPYFGAYTTPSAKRYPYKGMVSSRYAKSMAKPAGGHFGISDTMGTTVNGSINGLCTPCHDPHGVSQNSAKVANPVYGVPLLKGTWLTSPYSEDVAPANTNRSRGGGSRENSLPGVGGGSDPLYYIDQNTFQADRTHLPATVPSRTFGLFGTSAVTLQTQTAATSGGLCLTCHSQSAIAPNAGGTAPAWKTRSRVHNSVTGWGSSGTGNAGNVVHSYTCSKCHAPHISRMPKLLVTNCLDVKHRGRVASGGTIAATAGNNPTTNNGNMMTATAVTTGKGAGRFPAGGARYSGTPGTARYPGPWAFGATTTTGTTPSAAYTTNCHNSATAGGSAWVPSNQLWNTRSNW
ncbi:doubled CXXCH motif protein [Geobacter sp. OR-1]|nr:doubled CXXCH motif protein [Geobacter sp. OR-1]